MTADLLTLHEAADRLRVSVRTIEREIAVGRITLTRVRSRRLVAMAELTRYIAACQQSCPSASEATATKSASVSAAVNALSEHFRQAQRSLTPARSKSRLAAHASTLKLVGAPDT